MNFTSTNTFENSEYFTARNDAGQIIAQIVRSDGTGVPSNFWGYRMLNPGVGGKSQRLRKFGPFNKFEEAQKAIEDDFGAGVEKGERGK